MRRPVLGFAAALALASGLPPAHAAVPVVVIDGKGFGHGVGMAQDGAFWMGKAGATTPEILGQFYPGTKVAKSGGEVQVVVQPAGPDAVLAVSFPNGGEIRDARSGSQSAGFPVQAGAGEQVRLHWDGTRYSVEGGRASAQAQAAPPPDQVHASQIPTTAVPTTTSTTASTTTTTSTSTTRPPATTTTAASAPPPAPPGVSSTRSLWAVPAGSGTVGVPARSRRYRGVVEATAADGPFRLVDHVDVEQYLRGMGEVRNPGWPPASLRAQATAARTYALRAMAAGNELCDDTRCQVYLGADAEYAAMDKAVSDTKGQVLTFNGTFASAVYSANGGAFSASREEGFGLADNSNYPYLRPAPYPTQDPAPWTVQVGMDDVAARLGYPAGKLTGAAVNRTGPSGRVLEVRLDGSAGTRVVTGIAFARAFALKSTLFKLSGGTADSAPPPPPTGAVTQALPDQTGPPIDPNGLPPVPLASELAASPVPTLPPGPSGPVDPFRFAPIPRRHHDSPWPRLAAFVALVGVLAGGVMTVIARTRANGGEGSLP